jgi:nicotinamide riboside transporter PnuC
MMQPCPNTLTREKRESHFWGWLGAVFILLGYYLNANMYTSCWLVWGMGNFCMGVYCLNKKAYPASVMSFILIFLNIYGYFSWIT